MRLSRARERGKKVVDKKGNSKCGEEIATDIQDDLEMALDESRVSTL
jgi:hypothetical protein